VTATFCACTLTVKQIITATVIAMAWIFVLIVLSFYW
jgi:hypothetical protein